VRRRSWGASFSIPARFAASRTTSQITLGVIPSPQTLPALLIDRNTHPLSIPAVTVQLSTATFSQFGIGTVRMCPPFPIKSAMTQCSSRSCTELILSASSSPRRSPHPRRIASMAWFRFVLSVWMSGSASRRLPWSTVSQLPMRTPRRRTPFTRRMPVPLPALPGASPRKCGE